VSPEIVIGSRGSALALAQAGLVRDALEERGQRVRVEIIQTAGDGRAPDTAWGEGAFVTAIERALIARQVDVAVHSAKDVPTEEQSGTTLAAFLPRADPRDALVLRPDAENSSIADLPHGTRIGTDSPRRAGFLRAYRPDLVIHPLHGNVDTRLRRLDAGETHALVLACAGLDRLGLGERIHERLDPETVPPAPGQGAIAVQVRSGDERLLEVIASLDDPRTRIAVTAERAFLAASGGGCRAPIGALGMVRGDKSDQLDLLGGFAAVDGSSAKVLHRAGPVSETTTLAVDLIHALGARFPQPLAVSR
jgi:hydroxymethylbilane synthase